MNTERFDNDINKIRELISRHSLRLALDRMRALATDNAEMAQFTAPTDAIEQKYYYMLRFLSGAAPFGDISTEVLSVEKSMEELLERMHRHYHIQNDSSQYYAQLRFQERRPEETLESLFADYIEESKRLADDPRSFTDTGLRASLERIASDIFMHIWTLDPLTADNTATLGAMLTDCDIPAYDREMWLNAVGLSMATDTGRLEILRQAYESADVRMRAAALMWLFVAMMRVSHVSPHDSSNGLTNYCVALAKANPDLIMEVASAYLRNVVRKPSAENDRIMRDLSNMSRNMARKWEKESPADMDSVLSDIPEGYYEKMRRFNDAQLRGEDVFASTIGRMRAFPFFRNIPEWFLPFHMDRSELAPIVDGEGAGTASIMEKMPNLCDSDKFALLLSLAGAPESMRSTMLANTYEQFTGMADTEEGQDMLRSLEKGPSDKAAISNAVRGLARFVHNNAVAAKVNIPSDASVVVKTVVDILWPDLPENFDSFAANLSDYGFHTEAMWAYKSMIENVCSGKEPEEIKEGALSDTVADLFARAGHEAHLAGLPEIAASYLQKALDYGDSRYSTTAELASLILDESEKMHIPVLDGANALEMLEPFAGEHASDPAFLRLLGRAATQAGNHHRAAEAYFNLNYILPADDHSAKGPLARALCRSGEYDEAIQVLGDVPAPEKNVSLSAITAIALWLGGARNKAIEALLAALPAAGGSLESLSKAVSAETDILFGNSIEPDLQKASTSVSMLVEILAYKAYGSRFGNLS